MEYNIVEESIYGNKKSFKGIIAKTKTKIHPDEIFFTQRWTWSNQQVQEVR